MNKVTKLIIYLVIIVILAGVTFLLIDHSRQGKVKVEPAEGLKVVSSEITLTEVASTAQGQNFKKVFAPPEKLPPDQAVTAPKIYAAENTIIYYYGVGKFSGTSDALTIYQTNLRSPQRSFQLALSELSAGLQEAEALTVGDSRAIYASTSTSSRLDVFGKNFLVQIIDPTYRWPQTQLIEIFESMPVMWEG